MGYPITAGPGSGPACTLGSNGKDLQKNLDLESQGLSLATVPCEAVVRSGPQILLPPNFP